MRAGGHLPPSLNGMSNFLPNPLLFLSLSLTYYVILQLQILQGLGSGEDIGGDARELVAVEAQIL